MTGIVISVAELSVSATIILVRFCGAHTHSLLLDLYASLEPEITFC
jgi:hypothetical protein